MVVDAELLPALRHTPLVASYDTRGKRRGGDAERNRVAGLLASAVSPKGLVLRIKNYKADVHPDHSYDG
ncbi:jg13983 [Pararge aegeria aegeria]|uniref:Jg13983 protein n=1 Tax=Pararge aegeria aegeria TaxID=348720 RepID=A0A8S4RC41_9NEOP|nr:jg13983 [Pararge aegeria aegeria]